MPVSWTMPRFTNLSWARRIVSMSLNGWHSSRSSCISVERSFHLQLNVIRPIGPDRRVRFYLVGGAGIRHLRAEFPGATDPTFSDTEFTGGGGGGVRVELSDRFSLSPEFRLGWEPLLRATVGLGYELP
jgi:hypothetical protein